MNRRMVLQAVVLFGLFAIWTSIVRVGISSGSRESVWLLHRFGDWPETVRSVHASGSYRYSIFATFASTNPPVRTRAAIPDVFGQPVVGTEIDGDNSNNVNGSRYTTGSRAGALSSISVFVVGPVDLAPHNQFQLAIYRESAGAPGQRLALSASGRLVPDAWNTVSITAVLEPRTSYWLLYNTNGSNVYVNNVTYTPFVSNPVDYVIRSYRTDRFMQQALYATSPGQLTLMALAIGILSLIAARRRPRAGIALLVGFALMTLITVALKESMFDPYQQYPSGHVSRATYVAVALCFVISWRGIRPASAFFVALIGVAAIYTGPHYFEEVIGGALLGWASATAAKAFATDLTTKRERALTEPNRAPADSTDVIDITDDAGRRAHPEQPASSGGD